MFASELVKRVLRSIIIIAILLFQQCRGNILASNYAAYTLSPSHLAFGKRNKEELTKQVLFIGFFCFLFFFNEENVASKSSLQAVVQE